jgi:hypothetical protein
VGGPIVSVLATTAPVGLETPDVESSSDEYARRFAGHVGAWFLAVQARATLELLAPFPGPLHVLDVGGGHAQLAPVLIDAGHSVTVLGSTEACERRLEPWTRDQRCRFDVGDLQRLPYADGSFDVAMSFRTLAHLRSPGRLLGELCRVARRAVIVDYASTRSVNAFAQHLFRWKLRVEAGSTRPFTILSPHQIESLFREHGFAPADARHQFLWPMALHRAMRSSVASRLLEATGAVLGLRRRFGSPVIVRAQPVPAAER